MAFLVRKINKRDQLVSLPDETNIEDFWADIPTTELRTEEGALSTWRIETLEFLQDAVLAIATTSTQISKMDFIIMDTEILDHNELKYEQTYAGLEIPVKDLQNTHYDIIGITVKKIYNCMNVIKTIVEEEKLNENEKFIVRFTEGEIKDLIRNAFVKGKIDINKANKAIKKIITDEY